MSHKFSMPDERDLEYLIKQVFKSMPSADQSKLSIIESRLLQKSRKNKRQNNLNKIPWWIVLILAGGFATAAWWAGDVFFDKQTVEFKDEQSVSSDNIKRRTFGVYETESNIENNEQNNEIYEDKDSLIIYQRESY